eukprot:6303013-Karenia_brevis.AAC.1
MPKRRHSWESASHSDAEECVGTGCSCSKKHSWEYEFPQHNDSTEWEFQEDIWEPSSNCSDSDEKENDELTEEEKAGVIFIELLVDLEASGKLNPKWVCVLSYYAAAAGAKGPVKDFGVRPSAGHFSRHYDKRGEGGRGGAICPASIEAH